MKLVHLLQLSGLLVLLGAGCSRKESDGHAGPSAALVHEAEPPSGATFKAGRGVWLQDDIRRILQLETAEVSEQKLPREVHFTAQVFGEVHAAGSPVSEHAECVARASASLASGRVEGFAPGQAVILMPKRGEPLHGSIQQIHSTSTPGDAELILAISPAGTRLQPGDFLAVTATISRAENVMVVPRSALLRTPEGTFVYALNGESFYRTAVKVGGGSGSLVEITDGLLAGDSVVITPVEMLWLIELRATKGGAGCTDGH